jgi:ADP-ribosyl-[dinitrogen reductase] hydrolase
MYINATRSKTDWIIGNILGALQGIQAIPENWLAELEMKDAIEEMAGNLLIFICYQ